MATKTFAHTDGRRSAVALDSLQRDVQGEVLTSESAGYDEARSVWNAMIDRHPAAIVRCAVTADVVASVRFAANHALLASIRGGGHNIAGTAVADDALCIDLSRLRAVRVDPARRIAVVSAGARLADVDAETQAFGLATPLGINSTTGVAGLTVGGGFGWLSRKYGATVDCLIGADVVTADGNLVHTSETNEPDLFWALRGGGGNFGVVTSFEFRLFPIGPEVLAGLVVYPFADAERVFDDYRALTAAPMSDELSCWLVLRKAPPLPFVPAEYHGREVLVLAMMYAGNRSDGDEATRPFRAIGKPLADTVGPILYRNWQQAFDPLLTAGARNYWKSHNFASIPDGLAPILLDSAGQLPSAQTEIFLGQLGGAYSRVDPGATAYPHRDARFVMNVHARWEQPSQDAGCIGWAREFFDATAPYASGGVYVNFMSEGDERPVAAFGPNYARLVELKRRYDPNNLFRVNQNIRPDRTDPKPIKAPSPAPPP